MPSGAQLCPPWGGTQPHQAVEAVRLLSFYLCSARNSVCVLKMMDSNSKLCVVRSQTIPKTINNFMN